jgi:hypothetical protein
MVIMAWPQPCNCSHYCKIIDSGGKIFAVYIQIDLPSWTLGVGIGEEVCDFYHSSGMGNFRDRYDRLFDWWSVNMLDLSWGQTYKRAFAKR